MVISAILLAAFAAQTNAVPPVDGERIRPATQCFAMQRDGQTIGSTLQTIRAVKEDGAAAWDVVVHQRVGDGSRFDMRDHFVLRKADLRPIRFDNDSVRGPMHQHIELSYGDGRVTGMRKIGDKETPVDVELPDPVWEGNLWGVTFGALPLKEGGTYTLPFYQYDKGLGEFSLKVTGSETVATPDGPVEAWTVDVNTGKGPVATYLIGKDDGTELGSRAPGFANVPGGDCSGLS